MCVFLVVHVHFGACPDGVNIAGQLSWLSLNLYQCPLAVNVHQHKRLNLDTDTAETKFFKTSSLMYNHAWERGGNT